MFYWCCYILIYCTRLWLNIWLKWVSKPNSTVCRVSIVCAVCHYFFLQVRFQTSERTETHTSTTAIYTKSSEGFYAYWPSYWVYHSWWFCSCLFYCRVPRSALSRRQCGSCLERAWVFLST